MITNKALINSYVRLINQGIKVIDDVPLKYRRVVEKIVKDTSRKSDNTE